MALLICFLLFRSLHAVSWKYLQSMMKIMDLKLDHSLAIVSPCWTAARRVPLGTKPHQVSRRPWTTLSASYQPPMEAVMASHVPSLLLLVGLMSPVVFSEPIMVSNACSAPQLGSSPVPNPCTIDSLAAWLFLLSHLLQTMTAILASAPVLSLSLAVSSILTGTPGTS